MREISFGPFFTSRVNLFVNLKSLRKASAAASRGYNESILSHGVLFLFPNQPLLEISEEDMKTIKSGKTGVQILLLLTIVFFNLGPYGSSAAQAQIDCYTLSIAASPVAGGAVAADPPPNCGPQYTEGTVVTLTATPNAGYGFWRWVGASILPTSSSNPGTITMDSDKTVSANFSLKPPHDDFGNARSIGGLPYEDLNVNVTGATTQSINFPLGADPDNVGPCENNIQLNQGNKTVWYEYTPGVTQPVTMDTIGSTYDTFLAIWTGTQDNLNLEVCNDEGPGGSLVSFLASAGTTYYIQVGEYNGTEGGTPGGNLGGTLQFHASVKNIAVQIGNTLMGTYYLGSGQSMVQSYLGANGGPVVVKNTTGAPTIASYLQYRRPGSSGGYTGITQTMALTDAQITDRYVFPRYDYTDPTRYNSLQLANFDSVPTDIIVEIGGIQQGSSIPLGVGQSQNVTFSGVKGGPIVVYSDNGADIVATLYELKRPSTSSSWTGQTTMMGLPWSQLSDTYVIPRYNYTLQDLLPFVVFANTDSLPTTVTVTIGGVLRGTYNLDSGESRVESYPGVNGGPVVVQSDNGAPIIASYLQYRRPGSSGGYTGITQTMALTDAQISDRYVFPHYDYTDPTRYNSLQLANFDAVPTDIIVEIGGVQQGSSIPLGVGQSQNVTFSGVKGGPIVVYSDNGAAIVATLYELKRPSTSSSWTGQTTMMGLPWSQLSDTYVIPRYNYTLQDLLPFVVFGVP
jgi:hypothetical protein